MSDPPRQQHFDFGDGEVEGDDDGATTAPGTPAEEPPEGAAPAPDSSDPADRPAPVVTEDGEYWFPHRDEEAVPRELRSERWLGMRNAAAWIAAVVLVGLAAAALATHSVVQATSDKVARPALRNAINAIAEPEALIDLHFERVVEAATRAAPGEDIVVPGYAVVGVALTTEDAASGDRARMRDALLERSVTLVRAQGRRALAERGIAPPVRDRFSTAGAVAALLDGLTTATHENWADWRTRLVVAAAVLGVAVAALPRGFNGVLGLGAALLGAGVLVAVGSLALRVALSAASVEGALLDEYLRIGRDLTLIPLRNGIVLGAAGAVLVLPAAMLRAFFERSEVRAPPTTAGGGG